MQSIKTHLVKVNETLSSISKIYNCDIEQLFLLNPILKYSKNIIGKVIIVETNDFELTPKHQEILYKISFLNKEIFTSYINKFNDYMLIKNKLFKYYEELSINIFDNENDQFIFNNHLKSIHNQLISFIDNLKNNSVEKSKKYLKEQINTLYIFFNEKKLNIQLNDISNIIENRMLMIAKILNNNHYDVWELLENNH